MRDLPVQESAQVPKAVKFEREELPIEVHVVLRVDLLIVVETLGDKQVLTSVDNFVDFALYVSELILLGS